MDKIRIQIHTILLGTSETWGPFFWDLESNWIWLIWKSEDFHGFGKVPKKILIDF